MLFSFLIYVCILAFWYLTWKKKTLITQAFGNVVLFLPFRMLFILVSVLMSNILKTLKLNVFVMSFYYYYCMHLCVFVPNKLKTLKIHVFGNIVLFLQRECFSRLFCAIVHKKVKNPHNTLFCSYRFVSPYRVLSMHFGALVSYKLKSAQKKKKKRFWQCCYVSP